MKNETKNLCSFIAVIVGVVCVITTTNYWQYKVTKNYEETNEKLLKE